MGKQIRDVMTPGPETIQADRPAAEAAKLMKEADAGMIPVIDNGNLLGTVTDRDIAIRLVAEGKDPQTPVREIATTDPITVEPDRDLDEALQLMAKHQVRRLPVVESGRLVGVLAQADVAREGNEKEVGHTVEEISK
jgi:CBS domain-containing protein